MNEDVPLVATIGNSKMVSVQMPEHIFMMLPGLLAVTEPAGVAIVFFVGVFEKGGVDHSRFDSKFIRLGLRVCEQPFQRL